MIHLLRPAFIGLSLIMTAQAAPVIAAVQPADTAMIKKVENYLNGIRTYRAKIDQTNANGTTQAGWFYMERSGKRKFGKMRIAYDPPINDLIVVDGRDFIFYDAQAKEKNTYDIDATPAAFLLRRKIDLHNDLKVIEQVTDGNELGLKVIRSGDESGAALILRFSTVPVFKLNGWAVIDPQGLLTRVNLTDVNIGMDLDQNLFKWKD